MWLITAIAKTALKASRISAPLVHGLWLVLQLTLILVNTRHSHWQALFRREFQPTLVQHVAVCIIDSLAFSIIDSLAFSIDSSIPPYQNKTTFFLTPFYWTLRQKWQHTERCISTIFLKTQVTVIIKYKLPQAFYPGRCSRCVSEPRDIVQVISYIYRRHKLTKNIYKNVQNFMLVTLKRPFRIGQI